MKAEGRFPERILNIASTSGIYVYDVLKSEDASLIFSVSKKGSELLLSSPPEGITLSVLENFGFPFFWQRYKKRAVLISLPVLFILVSSIFSLFLWKVEFKGGEKALRSSVQKVLYDYGVRPGAFKYKIDQNDIKRKALMDVDNLSWIWVDIKGTTATVKLQERTPKPSLNEIHEPANVIAMHSGVIEKMQVFCGQPLFSEGMTVEKGAVLVSGIFQSENENIPTYYHHASANIILRVNEKNTVIIPKKTIDKTLTGNKKSVYKLNFKKNNIKFSLNSGISYAEYDKIEKTVKIPFLPLSFSRIDYLETLVDAKETDTAAIINKRKNAFLKKLKKEGKQLEQLTEEVKDNGESLSVTFCAQCLVRTDKEIPVEVSATPTKKGETNGKNS